MGLGLLDEFVRLGRLHAPGLFDGLPVGDTALLDSRVVPSEFRGSVGCYRGMHNPGKPGGGDQSQKDLLHGCA